MLDVGFEIRLGLSKQNCFVVYQNSVKSLSIYELYLMQYCNTHNMDFPFDRERFKCLVEAKDESNFDVSHYIDFASHAPDDVVVKYTEFANIAASCQTGDDQTGLDLARLRQQAPFCILVQDAFDGQMGFPFGDTSVRFVCFSRAPGNVIVVGLKNITQMMTFVLILTPSIINFRQDT